MLELLAIIGSAALLLMGFLAWLVMGLIYLYEAAVVYRGTSKMRTRRLLGVVCFVMAMLVALTPLSLVLVDP